VSCEKPDVLVALRKQSSGRTIIAIGRCAPGRRNRAWRQLGERAQAKRTQEGSGRRQKRRAAGAAETHIILDQCTREQRFNHTAAVGLPDVADLREGDRAARRRRSTGPRAPPATAVLARACSCTGPTKRRPSAWIACQERAARASGVHSPFGGGSDPLHLTMHCSGLRRPHQTTKLG